MNHPLSELLLKAIRTDGGTQMRAEIDPGTVERYADALDRLPPIVVFYDGEDYWLADGFHRFKAHYLAKRKTIYAQVQAGTRRDAVRYALQANAENGRERTPEDLKRVFQVILADEEWGKLPDTRIAELAGVSPRTVGRYLKDLSSARPKMRTVERGGASYPMDVSSLTRKAFDALPEAKRLEIIQKKEEEGRLEAEREKAERENAPARPPADPRTRIVVMLPPAIAEGVAALAQREQTSPEAILLAAAEEYLERGPHKRAARKTG